MVSTLDELQERNILKLILIVRFACAIFDVGHPMVSNEMNESDLQFEKHDEQKIGRVAESQLIGSTVPQMRDRRLG
jgi:hypothetical protein